MEKILVFIPMYNSEIQISRVIDQFLDERISRWITEVIIVNNCSSDLSEAAAIEHLRKTKIKIPFKVIRNNQNYGLGGSHKVAWKYAVENGFDYVITLHGDDQGSILDLMPYLKNGLYQKYDCLLGSRFCKNAKLVGYSKFRTFGNRVYNVMFSCATGLKIEDLGAGLNLYKVDMLRDNHYRLFNDNLTFNYYGVLALSFYRQKFFFFPITWREDDQVSNVKLFNQAMNTLRMVLKYVSNRKKFMDTDHRLNHFTEYAGNAVYLSEEGVAI